MSGIFGWSLSPGCEKTPYDEEAEENEFLEKRRLELYNRYKDNFSLFKAEHSEILKKHPESVGDWDVQLLDVLVDEIIEKEMSKED